MLCPSPARRAGALLDRVAYGSRMGEDAHGPREAAQIAQIALHAETIAAIHARGKDQRSRSQRYVEAFTATLGRPSTIIILLVLIAAWITWNGLRHRSGHVVVDPPPYFWLQGAVSLYAALVSTFVLTTQSREKRHAEQRAYLELQVNLFNL